MTKVTLEIEGMACSMCGSHINEAVRKAFDVKKVSSSHSKNQTVILTEQEIDEQALRQVIDATGYRVSSIRSEPYQKKGLFSFGR
ncbi:heavy-metal-associated domain-containing protein [Intestinimonas butyriciproducens]|uniref:heavy-metal-associated domain-containing protein n=1 Tax=Intestinimonas butyriciproducens TaxID=1297617 RepID=UPI0018A8CD3D|nr:heavy-metal-associated domain-containing protein [Intestinimonas butyriciproducens]MDB7816765.1 heavy-metal-associated domain-containing protein [Intestinimonas butyriciproducens]MDB7842465.1 heavy-metal-associated domain-containing protein [Intestinimonas butyriciproducens]MDB7857787.1 heavy-metal-associated domain-containing protein [Intestinimonas butyriciproducens]